MKTKYIIVETDSMSPYLISYNKLILILFCNFYIFKKFHNLEFDKNVTYIAGLVHILPLGAGPLIYLNSNMSITVILAPPYSKDKYPTTPMFYVLLSYMIHKQPKKIKIPPKNGIPLLSLAPRDLMALCNPR